MSDERPQWQVEYDRELRRTAGYGVSFERMGGGGWWRATYEGGGHFDSESVQGTQIVKRTERLRARPDFSPSEAP